MRLILYALFCDPSLRAVLQLKPYVEHAARTDNRRKIDSNAQ